MTTPRGPILVALDGSARSRQAVTGATSLAKRLGIPLGLVEVVARTTGDQCVVDHADRDLRELAHQVRRQGVTCTSQVLTGAPVPVLIRAAQAADVRLIWLACAGRAGLDRWVLGSVADQLIQRAPVPVLIQTNRVPAESTLLDANGPIVVPLDGSELAELALPEAFALARVLQRRVVLARAADPFDEHIGGSPPNPYVVNTINKAIEGYLWSVAAWVRGQGVEATTAGGWDAPAPFLLDVARREQATLICMSTRGTSGLGCLIPGRVADAVVRHATVPVLLVGPMAADGRRSPLAGAGSRNPATVSAAYIL
jgi:nucleotide-binding universal stress UspA family protein